MGAVVAIGSEARNCTAAREAALGALGAAYAYDVPEVTVLFKPTLTRSPHVYRPTKAGALSYFIGTCVCPGVADPAADPDPACGLADGYFAPDRGFAFADGYGFEGWSTVERGGVARGGENTTNFWYSMDGPFCHAAVAQGPICFTAAKDQSVVCVDKTFGFVPNPDPNGALRALLSTHHSSRKCSGANCGPGQAHQFYNTKADWRRNCTTPVCSSPRLEASVPDSEMERNESYAPPLEEACKVVQCRAGSRCEGDAECMKPSGPDACSHWPFDCESRCINCGPGQARYHCYKVCQHCCSW
jgi:hypothetical protein